MDELGPVPRPEEQPAVPSPQAVSAARVREQKTPVDTSASIKAGEVLSTYSVLEGAPYTRSPKWMWTMLLAVFVLLGIGFGIDGANSLTMAVAFGVLVVVYALTLRHTDPTRRIPMTLTTYGVQLAGKFYPYGEIEYFYLSQFPEYIQLTLQHNARFSTGIEVFLLPSDNVEALRGALTEHVRENLSAKETPVQRLVRLLQL